MNHPGSTIVNLEYSLEHAAKMICNLKCGLCPVREERFRGCPSECTEDIRPWRCWVAFLKDCTNSGVETIP